MGGFRVCRSNKVFVILLDETFECVLKLEALLDKDDAQLQRADSASFISWQKTSNKYR